MKRNIVKLVLLCSGLYVFADAYVVKSVSGTVTFEDSKGKTVDVKKGMSLDVNASISTGLNSTLVVNLDGQDFTVKPMKKGKISELATASRSGVKIGSKVTKRDIALAAGKSNKGVATASSRASEAKADVEWEE